MTNNRYDNKLTRQELIDIFKKAEEFYLSGNPNDTYQSYEEYPIAGGGYYMEINTKYRHQEEINAKDWRFFGIPWLFRTVKATARIPSDETITDENANSVLKNFLSAAGGNDTFSLKYMVAAIYTGQHTNNDRKAPKIIQRAIDKATDVETNLTVNSVFANQAKEDANNENDVATSTKNITC